MHVGKRNALNHALRGAIVEALREADADPEVRVMIVRGAGKCFSSGYDLGLPLGLPSPYLNIREQHLSW